MDYNRDRLSNLLIRTKVTHSDLARLVDVSRVTVYNWLTGGTPHRLIASKLTAVLAALEAAEAAGQLPVVERRRDERTALLQDIVAAHIKQ